MSLTKFFTKRDDPDPYTITHDEFEDLTVTKNNTKIFAGIAKMIPIFKKIRDFKEKELKHIFSHEIDMREQQYNNIYITSDIHADIRKLVQVLIDEGIISINKKEDKTKFDPYSEDIYNELFKAKIEFLKANTLFIILGDLVDGARNTDNTITSVDDPIGNFELMLHIFLFNIKIKAKKNKSDVLFTLGNHDYVSIIRNQSLTSKDYFDYKHATSLTYFNQKKEDKSSTMFDIFYLFYSISPYLLLVLKNGKDNEFMCTHAGFITGDRKADDKDILGPLLKIQNDINSNSLLTIIKTSDFKTGTYVSEHGEDDIISLLDVLETRKYETIKCNDKHIRDNNVTYVVGHCPTNHIKSRFSNLEHDYKQPSYVGCSKQSENTQPYDNLESSGCIIADCFNNKKPQLILVDTAMSHAFRMLEKSGNATNNYGAKIIDPLTNDPLKKLRKSIKKTSDIELLKTIQKKRNIEFLLLEHIGEENDTMWINLISRKLTNVDGRKLSDLLKHKQILYDASNPLLPLDKKKYAFFSLSNLSKNIESILIDNEKDNKKKEEELQPHIEKCKEIISHINDKESKIHQSYEDLIKKATDLTHESSTSLPNNKKPNNPNNNKSYNLFKQIRQSMTATQPKPIVGGGNKSKTNNHGGNNGKKNFKNKRKHINKKTNNTINKTNKTHKTNKTNKTNKTHKTNKTNKLFL